MSPDNPYENLGEPEDKDPRGFDFSEDDLAPSVNPEPIPYQPDTHPVAESFDHFQGDSADDYDKMAKVMGIKSRPKATYDPDLHAGDSALERELMGEDNDLGSMYVKDAKVDDRFQLRDGGLAEEKKSKKWFFVTLFLMFLLAGLGAGLFLYKRPMIQIDGTKEELPFAIWIKEFITMPTEQRQLQTADTDELGYLITKYRINFVYSASFDYWQRTGEWPVQAQTLVNTGDLDESLAYDGWGSEFAIEDEGSDVRIRSASMDGSLHTGDDITYIDGKLGLPVEFESLEADSSLYQ